MSASAVGGLLLGALLGGGLCWAGAWAAAQSAIVAHEDQHQAELHRLALVQRLREEAIRRHLDIDHAESNAWQELRAAHERWDANPVLPMRRQK